MKKQIRLQFLTDEGIAQLKSNFQSNIDKYTSNDHSYFENFLNKNHYLIDSKYVIEDFTENLVYTGNNDYDDFENTKLLYDSMKHLPDYIMMDDRLWAAITHTFMWNYILKRRNNDIFIDDKNKQYNNIFNSFFTHTKNGKKRGTFVNCVSRLWWAGRLSYDNSKENPYELSEELFKKGFASTIVPFSSSNLMGREETRKALLSTVQTLRISQNIDVKRDDLIFGIRYLNLISGSSMLDTMSCTEIKNSLLHFYNNYYNKEKANN